MTQQFRLEVSIPQMKIYVHLKPCTWMLKAALLTVATKGKQPIISMNWINKMWYLYNEVLFDNNKKWSMTQATTWTLKAVTKWKRPVTKDYTLYDSIYGKCPNRQICRDRKYINGFQRLEDIARHGVSLGSRGTWEWWLTANGTKSQNVLKVGKVMVTQICKHVKDY